MLCHTHQQCCRSHCLSWRGCTESRPMGVALLVAGAEKEQGPVLYHTDPDKHRCR